MLELKAVSKDYGAGEDVVRALKAISLTFRKNEFVAVLGPSGCGKTTLMNIIGGLDKYTSGELVIDDKPTTNFTSREWDNYRNKKIGFVFQNYNLIPHQSILHNVELALTLSGVSKEERKKKAIDALNRVGLNAKYRKKPSQLSGGQMQRVAIARALVNSPEILLADEPTGALDTATSEQIMNLIKEVAGDKLVIMVTHNPDLATRFATRIINMLDGEIISDSDPYVGDAELTQSEMNLDENASDNVETSAELSEKVPPAEAETENAENGKKLRGKLKKKPRKDKTSMSLFTALGLSFKNLFSKKGRTILVSVAGSIGIIGISLILSVQNGIKGYIKKLTQDTLGGSPIIISETGVDLMKIMNPQQDSMGWPKFPAAELIFSYKIDPMKDMKVQNNISQDYIDFINRELVDNKEQSRLCNAVDTDQTGMKMNLYYCDNGKLTEVKDTASAMGLPSQNPQKLPKNIEFINEQYDSIGNGHMPEKDTEMVLVIEQNNSIPENILEQLGIRGKVTDLTKEMGESVKENKFDDIIGKEFVLFKNDDLYEKSASGGRYVKKVPDKIVEKGETVTIVGILRLKEGHELGALLPGLACTDGLYQRVLEDSLDSDIVKFMTDNKDVVSPFGGGDFGSEMLKMMFGLDSRKLNLRKLGGVGTGNPSQITIFAKGYEEKEKIKDILATYNEDKKEEDRIIYMDYTEMASNMLKSMINVLTYVLIGFTAISLLVSSVMIGIITYISVMERTKEIGILRAIGARKIDIARVFNAETMIIGFFAGLLGVLVAYIFTAPINAILKSVTGISGLSNFRPEHALIMMVLSILLNMIAGSLPAVKASKKDPVIALRSE